MISPEKFLGIISSHIVFSSLYLFCLSETLIRFVWDISILYSVFLTLSSICSIFLVSCAAFSIPSSDLSFSLLQLCLQVIPNLPCFDLRFFGFTMVWKQYLFSRNHILNFEFWSFPRRAICSMIRSHDIGQQQWASALSWPHNHEGKQLVHLQPFCTYRTILVFTFSTVFNKLHEIFNTLV